MLISPVTSLFLPFPIVTAPEDPNFFEVRTSLTPANSAASTLPFSVFSATHSIQSTYSLFQKHRGYTPFLPTLGNASPAPRLHSLRLCDTLLPALPIFGGFPKMTRWLFSLLSLLLASLGVPRRRLLPDHPRPRCKGRHARRRHPQSRHLSPPGRRQIPRPPRPHALRPPQRSQHRRSRRPARLRRHHRRHPRPLRLRRQVLHFHQRAQRRLRHRRVGRRASLLQRKSRHVRRQLRRRHANARRHHQSAAPRRHLPDRHLQQLSRKLDLSGRRLRAMVQSILDDRPRARHADARSRRTMPTPPRACGSFRSPTIRSST